jgi:cell division protein FtsB
MPQAAASTARRLPFGQARSGQAGSPGAGVRWDRLARVALVAVFFGVLVLYLRPLHSYWSTRHEHAQRTAELHVAQAEHRRLLDRRKALGEPSALETEARRLGMVRQGEKAFVVQAPAR